MTGTTYKPYVWLQSVTTSSSNLHFIVSLPAGKTIPVLPSSTTDNSGTRSRTIVYIIYTPEVEEADYDKIEREYRLDTSTDYDPVLDDIIIQIVEVEGGSEKKKGQGSVHHSEGDASGGD